MKMRSLLIGAMIASIVLVGNCDSRRSGNDRAPVSLWVVGDDALTLSVRDSVERAVTASSLLCIDSSRKPVLVITIPSNVTWRSHAGRTTIIYSVEYTRPDGSRIDVGTGSCAKEDTSQCAAAIVRKAEGLVSRGL